MSDQEVYGPMTDLGEEIHAMKYRQVGEDFRDYAIRVADTLSDSPDHFLKLKDILLRQRFLPGGRIQASIGAMKETTAYNCFVSGIVEDSMDSIMERAKEAAQTMRLGGGIGYDFSRIRPRGDRIKTLDSQASGPVSFMGIFDAVCQTIASSGHRRGAQMAVLRVDHPDILSFVHAKRNSDKLTGFNISVGVTDEFMGAVESDDDFPLRFEGQLYETIRARMLWEEIMRTNWDWAEPGVLFLDTINNANNLCEMEVIEATNPCGEQPLPPYGACLLGSFNLPAYIQQSKSGLVVFRWTQFMADIPVVVRAMDNVIDRTVYPLPQHEKAAKNTRRMGLGITGMANLGAILGHEYGSQVYISLQSQILETLRNEAYWASAELAHEKGPYPYWSDTAFHPFVAGLPKELVAAVKEYGTRNSHLLSIAPTGTISLTADNVSSGIEPPYTLEYDRTIQTFEGPRIARVYDYAWKFYGVKGITADEVDAETHVKVLAAAQKYVDSSVSKTCNVGSNVTYDEFRKLYMMAWRMGVKGMTTFRAAGKRFGIFKPVEDTPKAVACEIDPVSGHKTCGD